MSFAVLFDYATQDSLSVYEPLNLANKLLGFDLI